MSKLSKKNNKRTDHRIPLVRWSLHKYKYLWGVGDKDQSSSFQEGASHTYTLRLGQDRNSILYQKYQSRLGSLFQKTLFSYSLLIFFLILNCFPYFYETCFLKLSDLLLFKLFQIFANLYKALFKELSIYQSQIVTCFCI